MARGNSLTDGQNARVAEVLKELRRSGHTQVALQTHLGVNQGQLSRVMNGLGGSSWPAAERLAKIAGYASAREMFGEVDETTLAPRVEIDARYPNLSSAIIDTNEKLERRGEKLSVQTIAAAKSSAMRYPTDLDYASWCTILDDLHRKERHAAKGPVAPPRFLPPDNDTPPEGQR